MIYNTRFPPCLSNETMIHSGFCHLLCLLFGKCYIPWKCRTNNIAEAFLFSSAFPSCVSSQVKTHNRDFSLCFQSAHDWILLTLKIAIALLLLPSNSNDTFCLPFLSKIQTYCSTLHIKIFSHFALKSVTSPGMLFCYCVTWPLPVIKVPYCRFCLWVLYSVWWHIPEPKPILFCCHETFPRQSTNGESETTFNDLNQMQVGIFKKCK